MKVTFHESPTFRESPTFQQEAQRLLGEERLHALQIYLSENPDAGVRPPGGRGLRKIRWTGEGRGKRGGTRVIYYYFVSDAVIELVFVYAKNEMSDMTRKQMKQLADELGI